MAEAQSNKYKAGDLALSLTGSTSGASKAINTIIHKLDKMQTAINSLDVKKLYTFSQSIEQIGKSVQSISPDSLRTVSSLGTRITTLSKKLNDVNWKRFRTGSEQFKQAMGKVTQALTPLLEKVAASQAGLVALDHTLSKMTGKRFGNFLNDVNTSKSGINFNQMFSLSKWYIAFRMASRVGGAVASIVQHGSDFTETLNLWSVSMRDNIGLATEFVSKMNKAYGISEKTLMNSQAIFKNMLGSLGQIDEQAAYRLSEALVQISADFSSLYNVSLSSAMSKMQAMLAGQVRPIRSAGLDITETTLFMYYQQMGGTKTMRQLNRTEKQLLSIYAVFQQMGKAGALGDMSKTLGEFANQSRMIAENWQTVLTYAGLLLKNFIESTNLLVYVNALLITMGEIFKAIAKEKGITEKNNLMSPLYETTLATNEQLDKMGKLLEFDKFRALDEGENAFGIDKNLLDAITGYESVLENAKNEARELAKEWLKFWTTDEGGLTEKAKNLLSTLNAIAITLGILVGAKLLGRLATMLTQIGGSLGGIGALFGSFFIFDKLMSDLEGLNAILAGLYTTLVSAAVAMFAFKAAANPYRVPIMLASLGAGIAGLKTITRGIQTYAQGGMPTKGSMFIAGEAGAEMVYNNADGQSGVANIQQISTAFYVALERFATNHKGDNSPLNVYLDGEQIYENTTAHAKRNGFVWERV